MLINLAVLCDTFTNGRKKMEKQSLSPILFRISRYAHFEFVHTFFYPGECRVVASISPLPKHPSCPLENQQTKRINSTRQTDIRSCITMDTTPKTESPAELSPGIRVNTRPYINSSSLMYNFILSVMTANCDVGSRCVVS